MVLKANVGISCVPWGCNARCVFKMAKNDKTRIKVDFLQEITTFWPLKMRKIWFLIKSEIWIKVKICQLKDKSRQWTCIFRSKLRMLVSRGGNPVHSRALGELHRLVVADFWVPCCELRYFVENQRSISENRKWDKHEEILSATALKFTSGRAKARSWHLLLLRGRGEPHEPRPWPIRGLCRQSRNRWRKSRHRSSGEMENVKSRKSGRTAVKLTQRWWSARDEHLYG